MYKSTGLGGTVYYVYVHSYLGYGLMAARAQVLDAGAAAKGAAAAAAAGNPCVMPKAAGKYPYAGKEHVIQPAATGPNYDVSETGSDYKTVLHRNTKRGGVCV
jgi:apyrase